MKCYCVKCKSKTDCLNPKQTLSKNNKPMVRSTCAECGSKKCSFTKMQEGDGLFGLAKTAFKNRKGISEGVNLVKTLAKAYND